MRSGGVSRGHSTSERRGLSDRREEGPNHSTQGNTLNDSTDVEQQQGTSYQMDLFGPTKEVRRRGRRDDGIVLEPRPEQQASAALERSRALAYALMERVCDPANLNKAYKRVTANKGAPGIDGMRTSELRAWLKEHKEELVSELLSGTYEPDPVRGVEIPKPGGGVRQLGIPTVRDRFVQQAIHQVLESILDPTFSERSYGFRPGRSAEDALTKAQADISEGYYVAVDIDVSKFFDRVSHDRLMARLARYVGDKHLLRIVRRFLEAGIMQDGVCARRHKGTPQGGPLSPLLANLVLDELDKELEQRGHRFCRYADDVQVYVGSRAAGERVMASITRFLEERLRLKVNREKSMIATGTKRTFLGFRLLSSKMLGIASKRLRRAKARIRQITRRNRGVSLERMIRELNSFLGGWLHYYQLAAMKKHLRTLDGRIRWRLRCVRLKQCEREFSIAKFLQRRGLVEWRAWEVAASDLGWWPMAGLPGARQAMPNAWFDQQGLINLVDRYTTLTR